jgi:hypothetical protein
MLQNIRNFIENTMKPCITMRRIFQEVFNITFHHCWHSLIKITKGNDPITFATINAKRLFTTMMFRALKRLLLKHIHSFLPNASTGLYSAYCGSTSNLSPDSFPSQMHCRQAIVFYQLIGVRDAACHWLHCSPIVYVLSRDKWYSALSNNISC